MSETRELYHDGALCPKCGERTGTPDIPEGESPGDQFVNADLMRCAACGEQWAEDDEREIARSWFALGAYEQAQRGVSDHRRELERPGRVGLPPAKLVANHGLRGGLWRACPRGRMPFITMLAVRNRPTGPQLLWRGYANRKGRWEEMSVGLMLEMDKYEWIPCDTRGDRYPATELQFSNDRELSELRAELARYRGTGVKFDFTALRASFAMGKTPPKGSA